VVGPPDPFGWDAGAPDGGINPSAEVPVGFEGVQAQSETKTAPHIRMSRNGASMSSEQQSVVSAFSRPGQMIAG